MQLKVDYTGQQINNRFVIGFSHFTRHNDPMWKVECKCGHQFLSLTQDLKRSECRKCRGLKSRKRPYESLYNAFVNKASKRHIVNITYDEFVQLTAVTECHYCGTKVDWLIYQTKKKGQAYKGQAYNLDRKDSNKGYSLDNVVVCCGRCNMAKNNHFSYEEWKELGTVIRSWSTEQEDENSLQTGREA